MTITYITKENDVIDWICWKHYGFTCGAVEELLRQNPKLAEYEHLPEGLIITLPKIDKTATKIAKLWD